MLRSRYLDVTNDVAFKKVFSDKRILQDFLNAVLRLPEGYRIVELDFIPQEEIPDLGQGKRSIFDIKCKDEAGKIYVIEMQNRRDKHFLKRMQFYASHTYSTQLKLAKSYADLVPVIVVAISKSNLFPQDIECISYHKTKEEKTGKQHLFELSYVFIELKKFTKAPEGLKSVEDYWLYFLSSSESTKEPPSTIDDEMVLQAYRTVEQFNWSEAEYDAYIRSRLLAETEELNLDDSYERGVEKGKTETEAKLKQAEAKAEQAEAKAERAEAKAIERMARKMLAKNKLIEEIEELTGLSVEEILKLKEKSEKSGA